MIFVTTKFRPKIDAIKNTYPIRTSMTDIIKLNDILQLSSEQIQATKIRFTIPSGGTNPIELFKNDPQEINSVWFMWRNKPNVFNVGQHGICLVRIGGDSWLFTTMKTITQDLGIHNGVAYTGNVWDQFSAFYGRIIVKYHKTFQNPSVYAERIIDDLEVLEILPDLFSDDHFPGYDHVRLSFQQLHAIIERQFPDWVAALENQKGVYLITDLNNGKQYVGSATAAKGMLLKRWSDYAGNGHGGDVKLKQLVETEGFDYVKRYFQYTLLENFNSRIDDQIILERENWWKQVLGSRSFGYNGN